MADNPDLKTVYPPIALPKTLDPKAWKKDKLIYAKNQDGTEIHIRLVQHRDNKAWAMFCPQTGHLDVLPKDFDWHIILSVVFSWFIKEPEKIADLIWKQFPSVRYIRNVEKSA